MLTLTIIIPYYNTPDFLKTLLDSIPCVENIQIVVVNDNSTLGEEKFNKLQNSEKYKNVTFLVNDSSSKGAGACRNIGIKHAKGKWLLFADSDDFFIEGFYNHLKEFLNSDNDVVFFTPTSINIENSSLAQRHLPYEMKIRKYIEESSEMHETFIRYSMFAPWSKLIKRSLIVEHDILFDEILVSNDVMFSMKIGLYMKNFFASPSVIYCITQSKGSLTKQANINTYNIRLSVFIHMHQFLKHNLTNKVFSMLDLTGMDMLITAIKYKLGFNTLLRSIIMLRKNQVRIFKKKYFNPKFLLTKVTSYYKRYRDESKYYVK